MTVCCNEPDYYFGRYPTSQIFIKEYNISKAVSSLNTVFSNFNIHVFFSPGRLRCFISKSYLKHHFSSPVTIFSKRPCSPNSLAKSFPFCS
jgi:hypothetical protein